MMMLFTAVSYILRIDRALSFIASGKHDNENLPEERVYSPRQDSKHALTTHHNEL